MKDVELLKRLRKAFATEAEERLASISTNLLKLENAAEQAEQTAILEIIFRDAHSLKGAARAVNLANVEKICQSLESVFGRMKRGEVLHTPEILDTFHDSVGVLERIVQDENGHHQEQVEDMRRRLALLDEETDAGGTMGAGHAPAAPPPAGEPLAKTAAPAPSPAAKEKPKRDVDADEPGVPSVSAKSEPAKQQPRQVGVPDAKTVRIAVERLDALLLKSEELISLKLMTNEHLRILRSVMQMFERWEKRRNEVDSSVRSLRGDAGARNSTGAGAGQTDELLEFLEWNGEHIQAIQQAMAILTRTEEQDRRALAKMVDDFLDSMKIATMQPFSSLFDAFPRMVRDISKEQNKEILLVVQGGDIEVDRRILEEMKDPLVHLVRNAVDHGVEGPDTREKARKPRRGTIELAVHELEGNNIEIIVADDGKGIDVEQVKQRAVRAGVVSAEDANELTHQQAIGLIFRSGMSTSNLITEISGRGLGLAIVEERTEKLGGALSVDTQPGKGTSFRIRLPVTLATFKGILVRVGDRGFIVPSSRMERVMRVERTDVQTVENRATISHEGKALALVDLACVLGLTRPEAIEKETAFITVAVLYMGGKKIAFQVDEVLAEQDIIVKNLGKQLARVRNIAAATVLGSGEVVPILNVRDLLKSATGVSPAPPALTPAGTKEVAKRHRLLVVEDSITSRTLLKNILEAAGYAVTTAVDGQAGYTTLRVEDIDLVVSDINMPRMDGFELTKKIREDKKLADIPVVLVTVLSSREDRERGIDVGANAYIVKSDFDQSNLLDVIQRLL